MLLAVGYEAQRHGAFTSISCRQGQTLLGAIRDKPENYLRNGNQLNKPNPGHALRTSRKHCFTKVF